MMRTKRWKMKTKMTLMTRISRSLNTMREDLSSSSLTKEGKINLNMILKTEVVVVEE
jgi:hypothetical protein